MRRRFTVEHWAPSAGGATMLYVDDGTGRDGLSEEVGPEWVLALADVFARVAPEEAARFRAGVERHAAAMRSYEDEVVADLVATRARRQAVEAVVSRIGGGVGPGA